ncbi:hypothetical protein [Salinibaculum rarum]|uniref:hypothetical protein n=1 Tax=Salinibaculum rarum TaxID=3058903 RepID=UPI00265E5550|nr:hypothetical protein [Salinibaculum sp. KK48]
MTDHHLSTYHVDGTLVVECPNKNRADDQHFMATVQYNDTIDDSKYEEFIDAAPRCKECGATVEFTAYKESSISANPNPEQRSDDNERGLYEKYKVYKDGEAVSNCFVLEPEHDSAAREALLRYVEETDDEVLAEDLREWVTDLCTRGGRDV